MANSIPTNFDSLIQSQGNKEGTINAFFDSASSATVWGRQSSTSSGLTWGYFGGNVRLAGVVTQVSNGSLTLTASTTCYIQAHPETGAVSFNTTSFTAGYVPLYTVVTGAATVTSYTDWRSPYVANDTLAKALTDANTTLTQAEDACSTLTFTGTLTTTRNITISLVGKRKRAVYNGTNQSLQFIGPTGTGITVATLKHAIVRSDGTNIVRVTADT